MPAKKSAPKPRESVQRSKEISVSELKAKCLRLVEEVGATGHELIITKRGKPIARLGPIARERRPALGCMKGLIHEVGDIVHCDWSKEWEALRDD